MPTRSGRVYQAASLPGQRRSPGGALLADTDLVAAPKVGAQAHGSFDGPAPEWLSSRGEPSGVRTRSEKARVRHLKPLDDAALARMPQESGVVGLGLAPDSAVAAPGETVAAKADAGKSDYFRQQVKQPQTPRIGTTSDGLCVPLLLDTDDDTHLVNRHDLSSADADATRDRMREGHKRGTAVREKAAVEGLPKEDAVAGLGITLGEPVRAELQKTPPRKSTQTRTGLSPILQKTKISVDDSGAKLEKRRVFAERPLNVLAGDRSADAGKGDAHKMPGKAAKGGIVGASDAMRGRSISLDENGKAVVRKVPAQTRMPEPMHHRIRSSFSQSAFGRDRVATAVGASFARNGVGSGMTWGARPSRPLR